MTVQETAELFDLSFNAVFEWARKGVIDAELIPIKRKGGIESKRKVWDVLLTQRTTDFLNRKSDGENPETIQVKKSQPQKLFEGECFNYRNDAMGGYIANYYTK